MAVTEQSFRAIFVEFSDTTRYSPDAVGFWLTEAKNSLLEERFGVALDRAIMFFVAHNLALTVPPLALTGGVASPPVGASGPVNSRSVGPVSESYDTGVVSDPRAGELNRTSYGQRLWSLMRGAATMTYIDGNPRFR